MYVVDNIPINFNPILVLFMYVKMYVHVHVCSLIDHYIAVQILELWLTFIQPWRYIDPLKPSSENKESLETIPRKWYGIQTHKPQSIRVSKCVCCCRRGFVLENFPFFSTLLMEIIGRSFQMDLSSDPGTTLLYRVTKVTHTHTHTIQCIHT